MSWVIKNDVDVMQSKLYKECYHGHLPDDWWENLARVVLNQVRASYSEGFDVGKEEGKNESQDARAALKEFVEHVECQNVLIAEVFVSHGYNPDILDELCENYCGHKLQEFVRIYERLAKDARVKWNLPSEE